jgi:putative salt-induced outer membrane protein
MTKKLSHATRILAFASLSLIAAPAAAELPEGVQDMIDAAIATGDAQKVATVIELARTTNPDEAETLDAIEAEWKAAQEVAAAEAAAAKEQTIRQAGLFELWSGEGEIGAFQSTGNTDSVGVAAGLKLKREGVDWTHLVRARVDYQRQNGETSREQFLAAYEPRWQFDENLFVYGLAQFERDQLQGFDARYSVSGGLGYKVFDRENLKLSVKAGPAYRVTEFADGTSASRIAGLFGADFDWTIIDGVTFTQDANALAESGGEVQIIVDGSNTSLNLVSGLNFAISEKLKSRLSYAVEYDSNPPAGAVSTDTLTRFTVIYGF